MSDAGGRVIERLEDYRPLFDAVMAAAADAELLRRLAGSELVQCGDGKSCTRAIVARGPLDLGLTLELVDDESWSYTKPWHYCPEHGGDAR